MAALLPSLSSDDELENEIGGDDNDSGDDEVDTSFEFGGILVRSPFFETLLPQ